MSDAESKVRDLVQALEDSLVAAKAAAERKEQERESARVGVSSIPPTDKDTK